MIPVLNGARAGVWNVKIPYRRFLFPCGRRDAASSTHHSADSEKMAEVGGTEIGISRWHYAVFKTRFQSLGEKLVNSFP